MWEELCSSVAQKLKSVLSKYAKDEICNVIREDHRVDSAQQECIFCSNNHVHRFGLHLLVKIMICESCMVCQSVLNSNNMPISTCSTDFFNQDSQTRPPL